MAYKISTEVLIDEMQRIADKVGRGPTRTEMNEMGKYAGGTYTNRFGSWSAALEACGFPPRKPKNYTDEELVLELWRMDRKHSSPPKYEEMDEYGKYATSTYENRFGSWNEALETAGLDSRTRGEWNVSGEEHPRWKGNPSPYYGPNWTERREEILERDNHECAIPGCEITTAKSEKRFGRGLNVHHIDRIEDFREDGEIDYESANSSSNLVTLCVVHHTEYEFLPVDIRELTDISDRSE